MTPLHPRKLILRAFFFAFAVARAAGLTRPLRRLFGSLVSEILLRVSSPAHSPLDIRGHRMMLSAPGRYPPVAMTIGNYEKQTTTLFERILKSGMVVIDVGAHVGYFSLLAARHVGPKGKVFAFEPDPINYDLLLQNTKLNSYTNISVINAAVADSKGRRTLIQSSLDSGRQSTYHHGLPESGSIDVDTWSLDDFLATKNWPVIDLVKVDVEGAELDVLNGMNGLLERTPSIKMIIEFNPPLLQSAGVDPMGFIERLASLQFGVAWVDELQGVIPPEEWNVHDLVSRLMRDSSSVNLFCTKI